VKILVHLSWMVLACAPVLGAQTTLKIYASTTVNPIATEAAEILGRESGISIQLDTQGGSTGGISALGDGLAQIAMSSRNISDADREKYPKLDFKTHPIGEDAVAMVVSRDVWDGGVRALSAQQIHDLYEGKIQNWKELGGADQRIAFFNREPGRGEWEVFGKWLYGDAKKTPQVAHPEVGGNEEARNNLGSTRGGVTFLSSVWADARRWLRSG
jgi:phosphate transport system substrate-binding protein